jgi:hypothetical protein
VTLDHFFATAEVSYDGWPVAYAYRGLSLDSGGLVRNVNAAIPTLTGRTNLITFSGKE